MLEKILFILATLCSLCLIKASAAYTVPPAKLEAIYPKGLRVTVKDDGFSLMAFHGNLNQEMEGLEAGQWARDITKPKNGVWTFRDRNVQLKLGDKIYFWTYVIKNGLGYRQDNGEWTVTGFVNEDGTPVDSENLPDPEPTPAPGPDPTPYNPPPVCQKSQTAVQGLKSVCQGALIFTEDFNKPNLDKLNQWDAEVMLPRGPDYPFNAYVKDTVTLDNGELKIKPVLTETRFGDAYLDGEWDLTSSCTGQVGTEECCLQASGANILPPVTSGKITTRNRFSFKYGRIDVRAKLPAGNWLIPEINLEPRDNVYGKQRYESGLIRVAFARGNPPFGKRLYGGPVLTDAEPYRTFLLKEHLGIDNWNKDFHNYSMIWKPNGIQLFVDGVHYGDVNPGEGFYYTAKQHAVPHASMWLKGSIMAPLDQMFYISLGVRAGGINDFADNPDKPWTNGASKAVYRFYQQQDSWFRTWTSPDLIVDSVNVYALGGYEWVKCVIMTSNIKFLLFLLGLSVTVQCYDVPKAKLEAIYPKGLRVSIPDDGYSLFAFHGKLNEEMEGLEAGQWSRDITKPKDGRWYFRDRDARLVIGDKIYFWTYVIRHGLGYREDNGEWTVTGYVDEEGNPLGPDGSVIEASSAAPIPETSSPGNTPICGLPGITPSAPAPTEAAKPVTPIQESNIYPCELSASKTSVPGFVCSGQLLFEDNFNAGIKKGSVWTPETKFPGPPEYPFNVYLFGKNVRVNDGKLVISPITLESKFGDEFIHNSLDLTQSCTGMIGTRECYRDAFVDDILPPIITAKLSTKKSFSFKYGRIEIGARMPLGNWLVPELQLEPQDNIYGEQNYASGLLRVALVKGNVEDSKHLYGGPILNDAPPFRTQYIKEKIGLDHWSKVFHNYTLIWKPDGISLYVDGENYGEISHGGFAEDGKKNDVQAATRWLQGTPMAPFDQMFYISLGLSVGGAHEFPDSPSKPWTNNATDAMLKFWQAKEQWMPTWYDDMSALQVDYVRVYAL
nr:uncharacterized protein LOC117988493 [Maniola hyperantus]